MGYSGSGCSQSDANTEPPGTPNANNKLGRDTAFPPNSGSIGSGTWDVNSYWANNYGRTPPNGWSNNNLPSRSDVYQYEFGERLGR